MKFVGEFVTRAAHAGTVRAPALNHKIGNDAMEHQAVIERALFFLSGFFIAEFLGAFRESDEVFDGFGCFLIEELDYDVALRGFKDGVAASRTSHAISLGWVEKLSYTRRWPGARGQRLVTGRENCTTFAVEIEK